MRASRQSRSGGRALLAALAIAAASATGAPASQAATGDPVLLNEALLSHTGADTTEFVELYGTPGASLAGLALLAVEGDNAQTPGRVDFRLDFGPTAHLGGNGFYLVGNPKGLAMYGVTPDVPIEIDETVTQILENGSQTLALVDASSAPAVGEPVTGSELVRDAVFVTDGGAGDQSSFGAPVVGPDPGGFLPSGVRRATDGHDTDSADDWIMTNFSLDASHTPTAASPYNFPPTADCGTPVSTVAGSAVAATVSASDPDSMMVAFLVAVAPDPGTVTVGSFVPAAVVGGTAMAEVVIGAATPAGRYDVTITATNGDVPLQEAICQLGVTVAPAPPDPTPGPPPASGASMDALHDLLDGGMSTGDVAAARAQLLADRLGRVERFLAAGQHAAAQAQLQAFANQVIGLSPRWVTPAAADALAGAAQELAAALAVPG